ncbi:Hsp20 family protein [Pseudopontixanthobacter vadosimaris]|uniref:Hsp20 family protein n=1 Tax=Pseudopontixanthobacter vadosimaris TaxID=2726450 RepID=UPI001473B1EE|nr:Hsp20 family protein [Pseudopontixanthobacter vadosimaris]
MRKDIDFTPYRQSSVGFDRLFDLLESGSRNGGTESYPPYDLIRHDEDSYRIDLAIAGFRPEEVEIVAHQNQLTISGERKEPEEEGEYMHRGIATRSFQRRFQLADYIEVDSARFEHGLLSIQLSRVVPEAMKPRKIEISTDTGSGSNSADGDGQSDAPIT